MRQIQITLDVDQNADIGFIEKMLKSLKGVREARLKQDNSYFRGMDAETWFKGVEEMRQSYDPSYIDMDDERTRYLLSK